MTNPSSQVPDERAGLEARLETLRQTLEEYKDLERRHEREQALFLGGPVVIFTWGMGRGYPVLYVTPNIAQFGYRPDDFLCGRVNMKHLIHADDIQRINRQVGASRERRETFTQTDYRIICANGDIRWVHDFTRLVYDDPRVSGHGYILDITSLKEAEDRERLLLERLARLKRTESLEVLAGGIAHDLNNMLSPILAYPDMLDKQLDKAARGDAASVAFIRDGFKQILHAGRRAAQIAEDLGVLSTGGAYARTPVNLNAIVNGYLRSGEFQGLVRDLPHISIETELDPDLPMINGSEAELARIVANLATNGLAAMEELADRQRRELEQALKQGITGDALGQTVDQILSRRFVPREGRLTVGTFRIRLDQPLHAREVIDPGDYAALRIADTGIGFKTTDRERIFEPFFTRRRRTGHTGLGLAIVRRILEDHGGFADVQTGENRGATFILYFPVATSPANESPA